ncbi:MAG TPA: hypothetical protein VI981_02930 [Candidatus Paceibacterota bacterium]
MNKNPTLVGSYRVRVPAAMTSSVLISAYGGLISNDCLMLLAKEWDDCEREMLRIKVYSKFEDAFNVHKFAQGFTPSDRPRFRQTTIAELVALGAKERDLGLATFVYGLGSAYINPEERLACGMVEPTFYYPGLESMDGSRQVLARAIHNPWDCDTHIALVELS